MVTDREQLALPLDAEASTRAALYIERVEAVLTRLDAAASAVVAAITSARDDGLRAVADATRELEALARVRAEPVVLVSSTQGPAGRVFHSATRPCGRVTGARALPEQRWRRLFRSEARASGLTPCATCGRGRAGA
ncbi:MAG: hypothetical protein LC789_18275 [Actinobacteria bacterium]|nr:hypothetical protein [Actinomycetota bacterium]MCA1722630.1 hypothetical protein [Actinomycetota bacterium]